VIARLQRLLRWLFMRAEALFNAAFGDRMNPLYHLGAITFFLFWLVAGSGLYLYAFFETGVAGTYASVTALTDRQWYAGGIMRSLHRYASDALVVTMLLHMLRHFAFDRLRGFRWFSWVSGVALIAGVYVSGVNGYMLPWDQLAQFVIVASFEWLDWLPGFGGTLSRNFIYAASVNDRLFSLLSFMHIGVPLVVLLLMWIHVQRVPKARTSPPRPIAWALALTLLALSLVAPVASQGGAANLGTSPLTLDLDWFYLAAFPLLDRWPAGRVWALVAAATVLLVALPWLPWRRRVAGTFRLSFADAAPAVSVRPGETLLDAGLRQGVALPYECRNGGCGACRCKMLHGRVDHGAYQRAALPDALREEGQALLCCATALSDVDVEVVGPVAARAPVATYDGRIAGLVRLAPDVMQVTVALPAGQPIVYGPGQYVNIVLPDGARRAYSFAGAPREDAYIEFHVRRIANGRFTGQIFTASKVGDSLRFEGPLGGFTLREDERPILFIAGATGFAPVKSIVEDAFRRGLRRPMWLYWGVHRRQDLYRADLPLQWQREHANFHFVPVLSHAGPEDAWTGRQGLVHEAMLADFPDMRGCEVYVCGSAKMVEAAVPAFLAQGLGDEQCHFDAFVPAPAGRPRPA